MYAADIVFLRKKISEATRIVTTSITLLIILKNRLASGTLPTPMQLPMIAQVGYWIPFATIKVNEDMEKMIVLQANSVTPKVPASTVRIPNAHISAQYITVEGSEIFKYSDQPLNDSPSKSGCSVELIWGEQSEPQTMTKIVKMASLSDVAIASPWISRSRP